MQTNIATGSTEDFEEMAVRLVLRGCDVDITRLEDLWYEDCEDEDGDESHRDVHQLSSDDFCVRRHFERYNDILSLVLYACECFILDLCSKIARTFPGVVGSIFATGTESARGYVGRIIHGSFEGSITDLNSDIMLIEYHSRTELHICRASSTILTDESILQQYKIATREDGHALAAIISGTLKKGWIPGWSYAVDLLESFRWIYMNDSETEEGVAYSASDGLFNASPVFAHHEDNVKFLSEIIGIDHRIGLFIVKFVLVRLLPENKVRMDREPGQEDFRHTLGFSSNCWGAKEYQEWAMARSSITGFDIPFEDNEQIKNSFVEQALAIRAQIVIYIEKQAGVPYGRLKDAPIFQSMIRKTDKDP